jgi:hypothetical protein
MRLGAKVARLGGSSHEPDIVRIDSLALGSNVLHNVLAAQSREPGFPGEDGLIGFDVLASAIVDVDRDFQQMTIFDPAKYAPRLKKGFQSISQTSYRT